MSQVIDPEHAKILDKIVELKKRAGINCLYDWRSWGINPYEKSKDGIVLAVDYGVPEHVYTPDGYYIFGSISWSGNALETFWKLMRETFELIEIKSKRNDKETSKWDIQTQYSGPWMKLIWK